MVKLRFTQENLPTSETFRRQLAEAMVQSNPLEELLELSAELHDIEREHGMQSTEFYARYQQGELGDDEETLRWAILYRSYLELKKRLEFALMRQAVWGEQPGVAV